MKFMKMNRSCFTTVLFSCIGTGRMDLALHKEYFRPVSTGSEKRLDLTISVVMDFSVKTWQFIRNLLRRMVR